MYIYIYGRSDLYNVNIWAYTGPVDGIFFWEGCSGNSPAQSVMRLSTISDSTSSRAGRSGGSDSYLG